MSAMDYMVAADELNEMSYKSGKVSPPMPPKRRGRTPSQSRPRSSPTIQDVAEYSGVSTATISRCLNEPERVSSATRDKVQAAIDALGYAPNFSAKTLAAKKSGTVGAIIPTMENAIFARGLQAFQEELGRHGYTLLVASSAYRQDLEAEQIRNLAARGADALMLIGHDHLPQSYAFLGQRHLPYVNAWTYNPDNPSASVGFDNRAAMKALAEKVITLGHRRIGVISAPTETNDRARERVQGIMAAMQEAGLQTDGPNVVNVDYSIGNGARAFEELMRAATPPTAVICGNDVLAVGALDAAKQLGIRVPEDVSITGFDDIELAQISQPRLTTVHVPHRQMGRQAAQLLIAMLKGESDTQKICLDTWIVERETLGPVPVR
jgi:LacI family transcriptional regulator